VWDELGTQMAKGGKLSAIEQKAVDFLRLNKELSGQKLWKAFEKEFPKGFTAETGGNIIVGIIPVDKRTVIGIGDESGNVVRYRVNKDMEDPYDIFWDENAEQTRLYEIQMAKGGDIGKGDYITYRKGILGKTIDRVTDECTLDGNKVIHTKDDEYFIEGKDLDTVKKYKPTMAQGGVIGESRAKEIIKYVLSLAKKEDIELPKLKQFITDGAKPGVLLEAYKEFSYAVNNGDNPKSLRMAYDDSNRFRDYVMHYFPNRSQREMYKHYGEAEIKKNFPNYAKGGGVKERTALTEEEKQFIREESQDSGQGYTYRPKILYGRQVILKEKNGNPVKKWYVDNYEVAKKISDRLNDASSKAKGGQAENKNEIRYKGKLITKTPLQGFYEFYSDREERFLKFDDLDMAKARIDEEIGSKAKGGNAGGGGVDLFEDYENIPPKVQKILDKYEQGFEDGDYEILKKAHNELEKIGYTFEYYLDGQAYDLRKIGEIGKVEYAEKNASGKLKAKGGSAEVPFDMWEEYSRPERVKFLESIKRPTKHADYKWNDLPKDIRERFEREVMTPSSKKVYYTLPKATPVHAQGTKIIIERDERSAGELGHTSKPLYLYSVYMESPEGDKYWKRTGFSDIKANKHAEDLKDTIEAGYEIAERTKSK
jgi:hypothetical protein